MSVPTTYTASALIDYMASVVGPDTVAILKWTKPGSYQEIVTDTLIAYGVENITEATNIRKLRAYARREVWRAVVEQTVPFYDLTTPDGIRIERDQLHAQAVEAFKQASRDAGKFASYTITIPGRQRGGVA
jgi:hypothetical protein